MKEKIYFLIGIFLSGVLGWTLGFLRLPYLEKSFSFLLGFIAGIGVVFLGFIILSIWNKNSKINSSKNSTKSHSTKRIFITSLILLGGVVGSFFIYQKIQFSKNQIQNQIQSNIIQSKLLESKRKSNAMILMNNLFDNIDNELKNNPSRKLSKSIIERVKILSSSFEPNHFYEGDSLSTEVLSPERGLLLLGLLALDIDSSSFNQIKNKTTFLAADLRKVDLSDKDLSGMDLKNANLKDANLSGTNFNKANLTDANLWGANLKEAKLEETILNRVDLRWADLVKANFTKAELNGSDLTNSKLHNSNFKDVKMNWAKLNGASLNHANFTGTILTGTNLEKANLTHTNFTKANLNLTNLSNSILDHTIFSEADLNKTVIFEEDWLNKLKEWKVVGIKNILDKYKVVVDKFGANNFRLRKKAE